MVKILVVEDSAFQRTKLRHIISAMGYESVEAVDGQDGLQKVISESPDCILLDLVMPKTDGIKVLQILYERENNIPVIITSADIQNTTRQKCFELGAAAFINKPVQAEELAETLNETLASKKYDQEN